MDRKPVQLAVVFGATTGLYAAILACVTGLQADQDRALAAIQRRPSRPMSAPSAMPTIG